MASEDLAERVRIQEELMKVNADLDRLVGIADTYIREPKEGDKRTALELMARVKSVYKGLGYWKYHELEEANLVLPQLKTAIPGLFDIDEPFGPARQAAMQARQVESLRQIKEFAGKIRKAHDDYTEKLRIDKRWFGER